MHVSLWSTSEWSVHVSLWSTSERSVRVSLQYGVPVSGRYVSPCGVLLVSGRCMSPCGVPVSGRCVSLWSISEWSVRVSFLLACSERLPRCACCPQPRHCPQPPHDARHRALHACTRAVPWLICQCAVRRAKRVPGAPSFAALSLPVGWTTALFSQPNIPMRQDGGRLARL